ncbi:ABC transporter permease [Cupriavidus agavae]|uniref:Cu-processing system permease protein n=1 Tax=Cupriavidus agavae TaxID=1001822 RepID=A0A4Q7S6K1_9BURK|nr:ABC transporter permease subunit [Cupriavidus agavae]RZT41487.1 Cu-processing system permease protein [Cupriavidus agavae]
MAWIEWRQVGTVAHKELRDRLRNRWVLVISVGFAAFSLAIGYFGGAQQGEIGLRSAAFVIASLVSLAIYLIPMIALLLGFDAIVGERERGSLGLLLSYPLTRVELLLGKYLGLAAALGLATLAGFATVGVPLFLQFGAAMLGPFLRFCGSAVLLGMTFLSIAVLLSVIARDRAQASGLAVAVWLFFVLVYDLLLVGVLVAAGGQVGDAAIATALLLNPAGLFRILNVFSLAAVRELYGLASIVPTALASPAALAAALLGWIAAPLLLAIWRFRT